MAKSTRMTPTSKYISVKYYWFRKHIGKEFLIRKFKLENKKAYNFPKGLQRELFLTIGKFLCGC